MPPALASRCIASVNAGYVAHERDDDLVEGLHARDVVFLVGVDDRG